MCDGVKGNDSCLQAARQLEDGIEQGFADGEISPAEFGGPDGFDSYAEKLSAGILRGGVIRE